jgi:hypothetical protein
LPHTEELELYYFTYSSCSQKVLKYQCSEGL